VAGARPTGGAGGNDPTGDAGNDTISGGANNDVINGGAGSEDTIDFSDATARLRSPRAKRLRQHHVVGGGHRLHSNIEGAGGSTFNDTLNGSTANDFIRGGAGNDAINGNAGQDVIDFSDATGALDFTLVQSGSATVFAAAGLGSDSYSNIEGVIGGGFNDTLTGSSADDILRGGLGSDQISGGLGADKLRGGMGADLLTGGAGVDRFEYVNGDLAGSPTDAIGDFQAGAGGDVLDIAELLVGYSGSGLQNFVQVIDTGDGNTLVRVDIDGSGTTYGFQNAVVLTGVSGVSLTDLSPTGI
jgi:Ca2+-binding RTX toxin-like protein